MARTWALGSGLERRARRGPVGHCEGASADDLEEDEAGGVGGKEVTDGGLLAAEQKLAATGLSAVDLTAVGLTTFGLTAAEQKLKQ
jgi:hypothetical protein